MDFVLRGHEDEDEDGDEGKCEPEEQKKKSAAEEIQDAISATEAEILKVQECLDNHMSGHYSIKSHLYKLIHLAKALRNAADDESAGTRRQPFRSLEQLFIIHVDDKASIDDHSVPQQGTGALNR